jgi:hypothetical protein
MGHEDNGHYAAKHEGKKFDEAISNKIKASAMDNCITCALAHKAGKDLNVSPAKAGVQIDLLEYRITECQLGLFGYGAEKKKFNPDIEVSPALDEELDTASKDGRISCLECWNISTELKIKRLDTGSACEKKSLRIKPCQLGAF